MTQTKTQPVWFTHVPKTGGTSIKTLLRIPPVQLLASDASVSVAMESMNSVHVSGKSFMTGHLWSQDLRDMGLLHHPYAETPARIAVTRNPWDRAVSMWRYSQRAVDTVDSPLWVSAGFEEWCGILAECKAAGHERVRDWHDMSGAVCDFVDHFDEEDTILRFESIGSDWESFAIPLGLPRFLLHLNGQPKGRPYRDYYTPTARESVASAWGCDADRFGYDF
jgi:hypothetical protein